MSVLYMIQKERIRRSRKDDNMCKLFEDFQEEIKKYCDINKLDFEKVKKSPKCWGKNDIYLQHYDPQKAKGGLLNDTPAPVLLKIFITNAGVKIEQTEYTKKYLAQ